MTNYQTLAAELKDTLARFMPAKTVQVRRTESPRYQADWQRKRRLSFYQRGLTCLGTKRKLNRLPKPAPIFFKLLGEKLGVSESAARNRFYRKQIQPEVLKEVGV
jgi:hypothetical protein